MNEGPNILKAFRAVWASTVALQPVSVLPWDKTPSEDDTGTGTGAPPYANMRVIPGDKQWNSGQQYLQSYDLEVKLFVKESTGDLDTLSKAVATAFDLKPTAVNGEVNVKLVLPNNEDLQVGQVEYMGHTLQTATLRWIILAQQTKGA
jgi:hypothetical protein